MTKMWCTTQLRYFMRILQCYICLFDALTWFCTTGQGRIHRQDSLHFQKLTLPTLNEELASFFSCVRVGKPSSACRGLTVNVTATTQKEAVTQCWNMHHENIEYCGM
jgi:hypothetical protein